MMKKYYCISILLTLLSLNAFAQQRSSETTPTALDFYLGMDKNAYLEMGPGNNNLHIITNEGMILIGAETDISFRTNSGSLTEKMIISNDGKIGIGTSIPSEKLHVTGGNFMLDDTSQILFGNIGEATKGVIANFGSNMYMSSYAGNLNLSATNQVNLTNMVIGSNINEVEGSIRWNGSDFEGYDGFNWLSFTGSSGGSIWNENNDVINYGSVNIDKNETTSGGGVNPTITSTSSILSVDKKVTGNTNPVLNGSKEIIKLDANTSELSIYSAPNSFPDFSNPKIVVSGQDDGNISVNNSTGNTTIQMIGDGPSEEGYLQIGRLGTNNIGLVTISDSKLAITNNLGIQQGEFSSNYNSAGYINLSDSNGNVMIECKAKESSNQGAEIKLFDSNNNNTIQLDADYSGKGRIITDELQINGGSDLAENFDIITNNVYPLPGMLVSIDPVNAGKLMISYDSYDPKIAGVISGANGIETGMYMGQTGSLADGEFPIALTGRVYVYANEEGGKIKPGDFITSSSVPGWAMKANDSIKRQGAVIGKAMTSIDKNGFVLVLVNPQ